MPTDRQAIMLATLKARGPAHLGDLAYHPVLRDHYGPGIDHYAIKDDLKTLVDSGEVVAYLADVSGETATVAYDVVGADRPDWRTRYERALRVCRERQRRQTRERIRD